MIEGHLFDPKYTEVTLDWYTYKEFLYTVDHFRFNRDLHQ
jgi:hypothetical protein